MRPGEDIGVNDPDTEVIGCRIKVTRIETEFRCEAPV